MAINDALPGVEVTIEADCVALKEYKDNDDDEANDATLTRYIEAQSGQEFLVKCKVGRGCVRRGDAIAFDIFADGKMVDCLMIPALEVQTQPCTMETLGLDLPNGMLRKFCFSSLETVIDGHMKLGEAEKIKQLGTINVVAHYKRILGANTVLRPENMDIGEVGVVSEKALKDQSLSHSVGLGNPIQGPAYQTCKSVYFDPSRKPAASFVFRYRSLEALKSMLIIPRTPSPEPEVPLEERDPTTLTPEEQLEAIRRLQAKVAAAKEAEDTKNNIKRERASDDNPRPRKFARPQAGDTLLEIDDGGRVSQASTDTLRRVEKEVIVLD